MGFTKTQQAIMDLLHEQQKALCADDIFLQLNPGRKCYSYAAVYNNINQLCREGILTAEKPDEERRRAIKITG